MPGIRHPCHMFYMHWEGRRPYKLIYVGFDSWHAYPLEQEVFLVGMPGPSLEIGTDLTFTDELIIHSLGWVGTLIQPNPVENCSLSPQEYIPSTYSTGYLGYISYHKVNVDIIKLVKVYNNKQAESVCWMAIGEEV